MRKSLGSHSAVFQKPLVSPPDTLPYADLRLPAELPQLCRAQQFLRCSVRLGLVEVKFAREAGYFTNDFRQFADTHILFPTYVDDLRLIVVVQKKKQRLRQIVAMQELAARRTGSPNYQLRSTV